MAVEWDEVDMMDKDEHIEQASRAMKAMSHPLRLKILCVLGDKEISVQDIVDHVGTSQSNISQHLAILRDKGVLRTRKDANRLDTRARSAQASGPGCLVDTDWRCIGCGAYLRLGPLLKQAPQCVYKPLNINVN